MKSLKFIVFSVLVFTMTHCKPATSEKSEASITVVNRDFYQLKVYTFNTTEEMLLTDKYLKHAYLPGLKKQGIKEVGVFKPIPIKQDTILKTYVLIPFVSLEQFDALEDKLNKDDSYILAGKEYLNASHKQPPYQRIESTILKGFEDMPSLQACKLDSPRSERVYELRSYESATENKYRNKVDMFNAGGEITLFKKLGFNAVFYGEVISGAKMPNLMYMTTFANQESRDAHWKAFANAPEWKTIKKMPQYQNNVSHIDRFFLYPTAYSDY